MNAAFSSQRKADSRRQPRMDVNFLALVRGVDTRGRRFQEPVTLKNLSSGGVYLQLRHPVAEGEKLLVAFRFASNLEVLALAVAVHGVVRHSEPQPDGRCGIGIMFHHYRTL